MFLEGFDVAFIYLNHYRSLNQIDREHQAKALFAVDQDAFHAQHRTMFDADSCALAQVGTRVLVFTGGESRCQSANLSVGNGGGLALKENESYNPGSQKNAQAVSKIEVHEEIAWEQRHVQFLAAILPAAHAAIYREEVIQSAAFEMPGNELFMSRANRNRVPSLSWLWGLDQSIKQNAV